ncbi:MAG: cobyric acid synthase [Deltaproteobacteria bacterium]|nr:cobyric acid synthase [Deltaproteobacteria bacterium]
MKPNRQAKCLSILGTASDVGKSIVTTALCRCFSRKGLTVAPYKAQNMSNNSGVTPEGLEMGRAQIVQAEAAGIPPHVDMNPVLLKPTSGAGSQLVLMGAAQDEHVARRYYRKRNALFEIAAAALDRLRRDNDLVVMEGAGSCAEVNLLRTDFVNLKMAAHAAAPVILVGDIHRGGIFAQLVGTLACLPEKRRSQIAGFIVNRFRGDIDLFKEGVEWIERETQRPVFGVLPWYHHISIESEDAVAIENPDAGAVDDRHVPAIAVVRMPHISNFTDFDPLDRVENLSLHFMEKPRDLKTFKAVIIPGSKNTRHDLKWLQSLGWTDALKRYAENGGFILGICGGYQILGRAVHDPEGIEGEPGSSQGLGLLPVETVLETPKTTTLTRFSWQGIDGAGYEIHMGVTAVDGNRQPFEITERNATPCRERDGCVSDNLRIMGSYLHGLFETPAVLRLWLDTLGLGHLSVPDVGGLEAKNRQYDLLADHFERHVDLDAVAALVGI